MSSGAPKRRPRTPRQSAPNNVFINCPFDAEYRDLFRAVVFTVIDCGFKARCALEFDDGSEVRIDKIERLIGECRYGIYDLSRTELDPTYGLPRLNMPLELGLFLGAKGYGGEDHSQKRRSQPEELPDPRRRTLPLSEVHFRLGRPGHPRPHRRPAAAIGAVRDWLRTATRRTTLPGGADIAARFDLFLRDLPDLCARTKLDEQELTFVDFTWLSATWLNERAIQP